MSKYMSRSSAAAASRAPRRGPLHRGNVPPIDDWPALGRGLDAFAVTLRAQTARGRFDKVLFPFRWTGPHAARPAGLASTDRCDVSRMFVASKAWGLRPASPLPSKGIAF